MKRKKKLLELTDKCIENLTVQAAKRKMLFKPYAEQVLERVAELKPEKKK